MTNKAWFLKNNHIQFIIECKQIVCMCASALLKTDMGQCSTTANMYNSYIIMYTVLGNKEYI